MNVKRIIGTSVVALLLAVPAWAAPAELADAVMKGDAATIRALLSERADVNATQADGATALHWAVYRDDLETAELLIQAGANVTAANRAGSTPLALACINGNAAMIDKLIRAGADPNARLANGETALMLAARTGNVDAIKVLVDHGADINAKENIRGTTALMWAAEQQHPEAVAFLIDAGADVAAQSTIVPGRRRGGRVSVVTFTPQQIQEQQAAAAAAAAAGQQPDGAAPAGTVLVAQLGDDQEPEAGSATGGLTALVFAARQGDMETARILIEKGADVNQTTAEGWSPLLVATNNRHYKLATFFMDKGADVNKANDGGWTPLYLATDNRNIEGGDYPTPVPDMDHLEFIKDLLRRGANPNAQARANTETRTVFTNQWLSEDGATPFLRAAQSGDLTLMRLLLEYGADPKLTTRIGVTPLAVASGIGWVEGLTYEHSPEQSVEVVKMLLDLGVDVNAIDGNGRTAMHGAAHKGRNEVVQLLADAGARLDVKDKGSRDTRDGPLVGHGWLPLDFAEGLVRVGVQSAIPHPETAALLRKLMSERGIPLPAADRNPNLSICLTQVCQPDQQQ